MAAQGLADESAWLLLLLAFGGSLALVAIWLIGLLPGRRAQVCPRWVSVMLALVVGSVLLVDAERLVPAGETAADGAAQIVSGALLFRVVIAAAGLLAIWGLGWLVHHASQSGTRWRRPAMFVLVLTFLGVSGWSSRRFYVATTPQSDIEDLTLAAGGHPVRSQRYVGVTDQGREIPLMRWEEPPGGQHRDLESMTRKLLGKVPAVIQRDGADSRSNCHGWVFTRGRFLVAGETVELILRDNLYTLVTEPQINDIVIYRDTSGDIVHTGLVAGILNDGSVMVESKWSVGGRYLHAPERQPYSDTFAYYRSGRDGHAVRVRLQNRSTVVRAAPRPGKKRELDEG